MTRSHEEIQELLAAYALGAMPEDEIGEVRAHILSCEECMGEADLLAEASGTLALAVEPIHLPQGFSDRVLQLVSSEGAPQESASPRRRWRFLPAYAVAGSLALAAILGFQVYETQQKVDRQERVLSALLQQGGVELQGAGGVGARVVPSRDGSVFAVAGLEKAPPGHIYQLWLLKEGADPISGGTFDVTGGIAVIDTERSIDDYEGAAVTIEQAGGSTAPTTTPILSS